MNGIAAILFVAFPVFVSVYFENGYFNITPAKLHVYAFLAIPSLAVIITVFSVKLCRRSFERFSVREWFLIIFSLIFLISSILSSSFGKSFWGTEGWCVGAFTALSAVLIILFISRNLNYNHNLWLPVFAVSDMVFIIAILQFSGIDIFSMHRGVGEGTFYYYISTVGNVNRFAGYLSLFFPLLLIFYLTSDTKASRVIHFISLFLCTVCIAISASDSVYLGIGASLFFALPFICKNANRLFRAFLTLAVFGASLTLITVLPFYSALRNQSDGLSAVLFNAKISLPILIISIVLCILIKVFKTKYNAVIATVLTVLFEGLLAAAAVFLIFKTVASYGDSWGSYRGLIWRSSIESFGDFSPVEKLFGVGPEMLGRLYPDVEKAFAMKVLTAHSEPIQVLLSTGILGLVFYVLVWAKFFIDFFHKKVYNNLCMAFFMPLSAYFAQSLVNSATLVNVSVLIAIASCYLIFSKNTNYSEVYDEF